MKFQRNPMPRLFGDFLCLLIILVLWPLVFIYDFIVVLPAIIERDNILHISAVVLFIFSFVNMIANLMACTVVDTAVDREVKVPLDEAAEWKYCQVCDCATPPRSWHCKFCDVCIRKRDHHCGFTGCCIGHQNHRYFIFFLWYLFVLSAVGLVFKACYMWSSNDFMHCWKASMELTPIILITGCGVWIHVQFIIIVLNAFSLICGFLGLVCQIPMLLRGETCAEKGKQTKYNCGVSYNLKTVFGERMHVAWICPCIESQLPDDGYTTNHEFNAKN
ncbi:uncharacterized protein Dvir_GJ19938 [Drosophila virilis]|uniref:Palmitoyltransferase n=1 Tax=Drosophila virilis TaxID=7244 RepID=B4LMZ4_DROVI|nr:probable palmitoyltransferase ZDHHC24 [Drosophila virilis]EDW62109.2 uncharacterized protein Dvir_GJ19938 [Drosophila virilis]